MFYLKLLKGLNVHCIEKICFILFLEVSLKDSMCTRWAEKNLRLFFKMKIEWNKFFFTILQLSFNIRQFRKFDFKMLKKYQDFVFFGDPFKFELYENLKRTDDRNLPSILSVHLIVPMQSKVFFHKILSIVLRSLLHNLALQI